MPSIGQAPPRLACSSEAGYMLVEVLMTSLIVIVVGLGIFLGLEGASHGSGNSKHRSVAAALAQQDQDRMRAFRATNLSNYSETRTVTVAGVPYKVVSNGNWVSDSSGALSCSNTSQQANYIKINSQVSWPSMRVKPVRLESLVAPAPGSFNASQGNLVIRLTDQTGAPVAGVPVSVVPSGATRATEPEGCAVFGALTAGSYDVSYSLRGYVNPSGDNTPEHTASVVASATTTQDYQYAEAGTIVVSFDTKVGSNPPQPAPARNLSVVHSGMPGDGIRVFNPPGGPHDAIQATALFPFTSGYGVYSGSCAEANPIAHDDRYFESNPGLVTVTPGGSHAVTVRQPALNVAVTRNAEKLESAHVVIRSAAPGCSETFPDQLTNAEGALPAPGLPFGTYSACADDGTHSAAVTTVDNTDPAGTSTQHLQIPTGGSTGVCT